jgi:hypothetical protein
VRVVAQSVASIARRPRDGLSETRTNASRRYSLYIPARKRNLPAKAADGPTSRRLASPNRQAAAINAISDDIFDESTAFCQRNEIQTFLTFQNSA